MPSPCRCSKRAEDTLCAPIFYLLVMIRLYIYNRRGASVHEDELFIRMSDIKYFYKETCPHETKYWLVPTGEVPIRITEESYNTLKNVFFEE